MISLRDAYRDQLVSLMHQDKRIFCLEADLGGYSNPVQMSFPERYMNVGIAEHTMINVAAGLARECMIPFASTFAPFAIHRAGEAVKLSLAYMGLNIKLMCPYGGVSGAWFGPTHHCLEDFSALSSLPGIVIAAPHGEMEMREMVQFAFAHEGPVYCRLGRNGLFADIDYVDLLQYPLPRRVAGWAQDAHMTFISVGEIGTEFSRCLAKVFQGEGHLVNHLHLPFVDSAALDAACILIRGAKKVIVIEEHRADTGVGVMLQARLPEKKMLICGANNNWASSGGEHEDVLELLGLSVPIIREKVVQFLHKEEGNGDA